MSQEFLIEGDHEEMVENWIGECAVNDALLKEMEDDEGFEMIVEAVRAERIARGLNPDTGLAVQL